MDEPELLPSSGAGCRAVVRGVPTSRGGDVCGTRMPPVPANVPSKMLVEQDPHQTRVAILEDDKLAELFIERQGARGVVGNVYKGRVSRVLPGMQAAFVDIGLERDAFLYVADVREEITDLDDVELGDERGPNGGNGANGPNGNGGGNSNGAVGAERHGIGERSERGHGA